MIDGKIIWFDPDNGSDANDGLSPDRPIRTWAAVDRIADAGAGDCVYMSVGMKSSTIDLSASGWTCPGCGAWVPTGQVHICGTPMGPPTVSWERLARALERIADACEQYGRGRGCTGGDCGQP